MATVRITGSIPPKRAGESDLVATYEDKVAADALILYWEVVPLARLERAAYGLGKPLLYPT